MSLVTVIFLVRLSLLQHIQFAEVVQLLQDGTSMHFIARTFAVAQHSLESVEEIPGDG